MRSIYLLIAGTVLASCTAGPPPGTPAASPSAQRAAQTLLAGKVAGAPMSCLQNYNSDSNMSVLDGHTIAFNPSPGTVYVVKLTPGCENIDGGPYALVSKQSGGQGLCQGDIQQVVDTMSRINAGSCTVAEIIPYTRP